MISIQQLDSDELTNKVYDLVAKTTIELGHRTDAKTMVTLANAFSFDLKNENRFKILTFPDIQMAFHNGVRSEDQDFMSIPTFFKWVRKQKDLIDADIYKVRTLKEPIEAAPLFRNYDNSKTVRSLTNKFKIK
tara:strand:- start:13019 stop:13417 length:399 start_codon:yes stop_codon:yes gene_type:complete